jgi:hypothetical protein
MTAGRERGLLRDPAAQDRRGRAVVRGPHAGRDGRVGNAGTGSSHHRPVQPASRSSAVLVLVLVALGMTACFDPTDVAPEGATSGGTEGDEAGSDTATTGDTGGSADGTASDDASGPDGTGDDTAGGADPDAAVVSGDRLRRRDLVADGGARVFVGLHDTELDLDCRFEWAEDGTPRCLPQFQLNVAYADEGCTEPVFPATDACEIEWIYERTRDYACGEHSLYTTYRIDRGAAPASGTFWYRTSSGCVEAGVSDELLAVEHVSPETFVGGVFDDVPREGGVVARFVAAEDGARVMTELRDEARDAACITGMDGARCRPARVAGTSPARTSGATYADAACDVLVAVWTPDDPCPPDATVTWNEGCAAIHSYFEVGRAYDPADVTQWTGATCEAFGAYGPPFAVGAAIPESEMPAIDRIEEGDGRLRAWADGSIAGEPLSPGRAFVDTETGKECRPGRFEDGAWRCVPADAILFSDLEIATWSDPGCTGDRLLSPWSCAPDDARVLEVDFVYCEGETVIAAYELGDPFEGTTAYADYGDGCMPLEVVAGEWHRLGAALPATAFEALEHVVQ